MATQISLLRCGKTFAGGTRALEPIDLVIKPGECLVLLGPSGCGKTSLLRLIAGLAEPDPGGRILFDDTDVTSRPIEARKVGMVFQSYALFPNMNVTQNIGYGLRIRRTDSSAIDARVRQLLTMVDLAGLGDRRIDELSGGQKQRVALARAVAVEPAVLLLDEPLTALDAKLRETLRLELKNLLTSLGITSVFVTHDQAEAMALGDRIAVMSQGRIEQIGSASDIYNRPATRFVAQFVGLINTIRLPDIGEIMVRPEHIEIVPSSTRADPSATYLSMPAVSVAMSHSPAATAPLAATISLAATIQRVTFLGKLTQIEARLDDGQAVLIEAARNTLITGMRVQLHFANHSILRATS